MKFITASAVLASLYLTSSSYSSAVSGFSVSSSKVKQFAAFVPTVQKAIRGGSFSPLSMSDVATQEAVAKGETYEYVGSSFITPKI